MYNQNPNQNNYYNNQGNMNQNQYMNPDAYNQSNQNAYNYPPLQNQYGNPPMPPGYQQPYQNPNAPYGDQMVYVQMPIAQGPILIENQIASRNPQAFYCPYCLKSIVTEVKYEPGDKTSLMACCLCFFGGIICCLVPYCVDDCQDAIHLCPLCKSVLGKVPF